MSIAPRTPRTAHDQTEREAAYQVYATLETPSVKETAAILGISPRTVERWCADDGWVSRRAGEVLDRVATIRRIVDLKLLTNAEKLTDRTIELAMQDDDLPTAARMTIHALGLLGYTPVSKSASIVQHLGEGDSSSIGRSGDDARSLGEIVDAFNARLAALGAPTPPQDIKNEDERKMTGGVPTETVPTVSNSSFYRSDTPEADEDFFEVETAPRPSGGEGADGEEGAVIEASFREA